MFAEAYQCRCGERALPQQVVERNCVALRGIPLFVHVQYQCEACGQAGEKLLAYRELAEPGEALAPGVGPIPAEEVIRFAGAVGRVGAADLAYLRSSLRPEH